MITSNTAAQSVVGRQPFDAAPFGFASTLREGLVREIRWAEPRKIRRVVIEFPEGAEVPQPGTVRLRYWRGGWDGLPDPVLAERGAGRVGWERMDDWTNGKWQDADANLHTEGTRLVLTFNPTGAKEFEKLGQPGVTYRKTLMIRVVSDAPLPADTRVRAVTDSIYQPLTFRLHWGTPADPAIKSADNETPPLEVFNGEVVSPLTPVQDPSRGGQMATVLMTAAPGGAGEDRTIVTVRSAARPFSFEADAIARGEQICVDDLGVLVVRGDDPMTLDAWRDARKEHAGRTVYQRVFDEPEQTLARAWDDMPLKRPLYFVHGLPGNRDAMHQRPDGEIVVTSGKGWFKLPPSDRDTKRQDWPGRILKIGFGLPAEGRPVQRELLEGYLPLLRAWWQVGPVYYEERSILDKLDGDLSEVRLDDPTVLLVRLRLVNTSAARNGTASLYFTSAPEGGSDKLVMTGDRAEAVAADARRLRFLVRLGGRGKLVEEGDGMRWTLDLKPGEAHQIDVAIPSITLTSDDEIQPLLQRDFDAAGRRICDYWREQTARGAAVTTPEPWLNDFYKSHLRHLLVNCYKEVDSDRLHAHVGTFNYGVYPDESAMMISDLDRRGYHDEARRCLDSFLHYQGTVQMPGNFKTKEGLFYGSGGHDHGGYNKSHGWVLWNMADHWHVTRDREWMERAAPKLVAACDWVSRERRVTMTQRADGTRPLEYGFLPTGSLEDVTDYWYWMVTNVCTVWGFEALADALADFGHPEAGRLRAEARAFRDDVMRAVEESRVITPVVRLRDDTCVPKYPSRLYERGRSHGWLRETLEGSIHLLITGMIAPDAPEARWILDDFEDNLYISDAYGYGIPAFDRFWFSRGGFSMQANLLGGPLPYLYRDEIKHYLRAYFNAFTSAFYPDIRMCNEHSLPELGYPAGDHFKSSDEAQSTYWLRLMFVNERGGDLYLGQAIPRYWLADGQRVAIERAPSRFGPLSFEIASSAAGGRIEAVLTPPSRNPLGTIYVRLRHPQHKPIRDVTLNGEPYPRFDAEKEWIVLPGRLEGPQRIVARYE